MVVDSQNFLELDFMFVERILANSNLRITTELEVFNAAHNWISHNIKDRTKFAKSLLLNVRLSLLSEYALKHLLNNSSSFSNNDACVEILKKHLHKKDNLVGHRSELSSTNRYCSQNKFGILVCGGFSYISWSLPGQVNQIDGTNFKSLKVLPPMTEALADFQTVFLKGEAYFFSGYGADVKFQNYFNKFSFATNRWNKAADMYDDRRDFCTCAFMNKIFVIGGCYTDFRVGDNWERTDWRETDSCVVYDVTDNRWREVARMKQVRAFAACTGFEGKVVVSGGKFEDESRLKSVESYDAVADEWSRMPSMVGSKSEHSMVAVRNKLFAVGRKSFEVFDSTSRKFITLKLSLNKFKRFNSAVSIGNKICVFQNNLRNSSVFCYDINKNEWSEESCEVIYNLKMFSCLKVPSF